jgi:hypothetical protein
VCLKRRPFGGVDRVQPAPAAVDRRDALAQIVRKRLGGLGQPVRCGDGIPVRVIGCHIRLPAANRASASAGPSSTTRSVRSDRSGAARCPATNAGATAARATCAAIRTTPHAAAERQLGGRDPGEDATRQHCHGALRAVRRPRGERHRQAEQQTGDLLPGQPRDHADDVPGDDDQPAGHATDPTRGIANAACTSTAWYSSTGIGTTFDANQATPTSPTSKPCRPPRSRPLIQNPAVMKAGPTARSGSQPPTSDTAHRANSTPRATAQITANNTPGKVLSGTASLPLLPRDGGRRRLSKARTR